MTRFPLYLRNRYILFGGKSVPESISGLALWKVRLLRVCLVGAGAGVAASFPHFGHVMGVIGGLGSTVALSSEIS